ncbi:hypothetical protein [Clostridium tyrobutyricum]|uniref:hypothetical protein n=1 Tax=Clostridium tyrobutyricum TaxID=1519 RepID=UPI001C38959F|nr:hypothetical protein [Clostridium tyrobutyricum]MBV4423142.1 hypothetical protein [Clostridium tyrobutyricum]
MNECKYIIFTKEDYKRYRLSKLNGFETFVEVRERINTEWDHMRNGHHFIIGVGKDSLTFFSLEYFEKHILD